MIRNGFISPNLFICVESRRFLLFFQLNEYIAFLNSSSIHVWETIVSYDVLFHQEEHPYPLNMSVDEQEYHGGGAVADSFNTGPNHFGLNLSPNNQLPSYRCAWGTRSSKSRMTRFRSKGAAQGSDHCDMMCSNIWVWYLWMLLNVYIMNNYVRFSFWHLSLDSFQSLRSASFPPSFAAKL